MSQLDVHSLPRFDNKSKPEPANQHLNYSKNVDVAKSNLCPKITHHNNNKKTIIDQKSTIISIHNTESPKEASSLGMRIVTSRVSIKQMKPGPVGTFEHRATEREYYLLHIEFVIRVFIAIAAACAFRICFFR